MPNLYNQADPLKTLSSKDSNSDCGPAKAKNGCDNSSRSNNGVVILKPRREIVIEELQTEFDKQLDKIALINDFMALHGEKSKIKGDLTLLKNKTDDLKGFLSDARQKIQIFKTEQLPRTNLLINNMRQQHLKMLEMLAELDDSEKDICSSRVTSNNENNAAPPPVVTPESSKQQNRQTFVIAPTRLNTITPKRHQSPFVLRANPRALCQLSQQFQIDIDSNEFEKIPKYLKGRDSIGNLNFSIFSKLCD